MRQSITSFSNPKIKWISSLREKRNRDREGLFVIEGFREVSRALVGSQRDLPMSRPPLVFESLWISPDCYLGTNEETLVNQFQCPIYVLPQRIFEKISYRDRPDGILAVAKTPILELSPAALAKADANPILWIEGVEKPGNLGTILRTAEGAGVGLVLVSDPKTDLYNPNIVRSSTGALFTIPVYLYGLEEGISALKSKGYQILAITPEGDSLYTQVDLRQKTVLLFGSEQYGLTSLAKESADASVYLPMQGEADSLNLAMSCGIVLYESLRQRMV